jgi:hypothetical protein
MITTPGIHELTNDAYHADPALSASGAKLLVPPSTPALFRYRQDHPERRSIFDFGSAAHKAVLQDDTATVEIIDAPDWKTKAAREQRDAAYAAGAIPLLVHESTQVDAMAEQIRAHPIARRLFAPGSGKPEVSMFWQDDQTGQMLRSRLDWLPNPGASGRLIVPDYKTCHSAERDAFGKSAASFGYHLQAAWYLAGIRALGMDVDPAFVFVAQEKTPPYLVNVIELDMPAMEIGALLMRRAIDVFVECQKRDVWPGYADEVQTVSLPVWYQRLIEDGDLG